MEPHPGVFTSDVNASRWEPVPDYPGTDFHTLVESNGINAGLWRVTGDAMTLSWKPMSREVFAVLEGEVQIEIPGGPTLNLKPGNIASLPAGLQTTWHVTTPFKDLYVIT